MTNNDKWLTKTSGYDADGDADGTAYQNIKIAYDLITWLGPYDNNPENTYLFTWAVMLHNGSTVAR